MPIPFNQFQLLTWNDVERCPFPPQHPLWLEWNQNDDKRMLLIALEKYANIISSQISESIDQLKQVKQI